MPALGVTDIDLLGRALVNLGQTPIDSLTDDDEVSQICAVVYPAVRDEVLGLYPWRCLLKEVQLARLTPAPVGGFSYAYQLPTDRVGEIRTVWNTDRVGRFPFKQYKISEDTLLTDAEEIWVEYPYLINESAFPAHVRALMVLALSERLAEPITEDSSKAAYWGSVAYGLPSEGRMGGYFARARLLDSSQSPNQELGGGTEYDLINVRG